MGFHALIFVLTFLFMEWAAWALHCYVMHGFLWSLHEDHHRPDHHSIFQRNDWFAVFFAVPSFFSILLGTYWLPSWIATIGYGIMAYGIAYFFVHEVIIHRRLKIRQPQHWYIEALVKAHRDHHAVTEKEGAYNFGMLIVPFKYYRKALSGK